jgi:hypothetical protein
MTKEWKSKKQLFELMDAKELTDNFLPIMVT